MKDRDHGLAHHLGHQRTVVAHLPGHQALRIAILEYIPPGPGAHSHRGDSSTLPGRSRRRRYVSERADALSNTPRQLREGDGLSEAHEPAVTRALEALGCRRDGLDSGAQGYIGAGCHDIGQPVVDAARRGVDGGVGAVHGDVVAREGQEDTLLWVGMSDGLEAAKDDGVYTSIMSVPEAKVGVLPSLHSR